MTDESIVRRRKLDHERYMRNRDERLRLAKVYRDKNKSELDIKRRNKLLLMWQERYKF